MSLSLLAHRLYDLLNVTDDRLNRPLLMEGGYKIYNYRYFERNGTIPTISVTKALSLEQLAFFGQRQGIEPEGIAFKECAATSFELMRRHGYQEAVVTEFYRDGPMFFLKVVPHQVR